MHFINLHSRKDTHPVENLQEKLKQICSTEQKNLSNQEETLQFKFLAVFKYNCIGGAFAVITEFLTGAISARFIAWFWEERSNH